jgi:hypothetical protein
MGLPLLRPIGLGALTLIQVENPSPANGDLHFLFFFYLEYQYINMLVIYLIFQKINYEIIFL